MSEEKYGYSFRAKHEKGAAMFSWKEENDKAFDFVFEYPLFYEDMKAFLEKLERAVFDRSENIKHEILKQAEDAMTLWNCDCLNAERENDE